MDKSASHPASEPGPGDETTAPGTPSGMKDKRTSGKNLGGCRRHGDPPAWLDQTLPLEERRKLLDRAIRAMGSHDQVVGRQRAGDVPDPPQQGHKELKP